MNKIYSCDIIMDLLPSYMEKIVSDETAEVVEEHIAHCECCKDMYMQMGCDINLIDNDKCKKKKKRRGKKPGKAKVIILGYLLVLMLILAFIVCDLTFGA